MEFEKKIHVRAVNVFGPRADVGTVLALVREQRIAGELVVSLPGNGGISSIVFRESEKIHDGAILENVSENNRNL